MDRAIAAGQIQELIVVMPDADKTCHYTDSTVKGGWGSFVAKDLVEFVDRTYRSVPAAHARGIMGHSMGGHGAIKLAMTHPGTFSVVYAMNPSMLGWGGDVSADNPELAAAGALTRPGDLADAGFYTRAVVGIGQCFSPDPAAPLLTTPPFTRDAGGRLQPGPAHVQWTSQMPVYMVPRHVAALKALRGLRFDSAFTDEFTHIPVTTRALSAALDAAGVAHIFEMYDGDHRNRLWGPEGRIATVALPYFSRLLGETTTAPASAPSAGRRAAPPASPSTSAAQAALWDAAIAGDLRAAARALTAGADVNALDTRVNANGRRALNHAAEHNRAELIRWLVANGADVNRPNQSGFTPLHHAAEAGSVAAAEALLALGANPKATLPSGSTPLDVARQRGRTAVVQLLEKHRDRIVPDRRTS
jgi:hypothetical protein